MSTPIRRLLLGRPLPTWRAAHERLPKVLALPVFASDAMSSNAYATEEILRILILAGIGALDRVLPLTLAIVVLLAIVVTSYRQTIFAYPSGGGAYIVAKDNLGTLPGLTAASALLIDYVLTVSVSIAAGVSAINSAYPETFPYRVDMCVVAIVIVMLANLRGVRESGFLFAFPSYAFIASFIVMISVGAVKAMTGTLQPAPVEPVRAVHPLTLFLVLRAFSGGCVALTGTEAISNGIPAFRPPESKNAAATLVWMALVLGTFFIGISSLAHYLGVAPSESEAETVVSQIARSIFGSNWFYYIIQYATAAILILAANTSFADFPRLSSILARDRFMPRQFANVGDRLAFSNGIIALAGLAIILIIVFGGEVHALIPLYAVGVFLSFTLSQYGMVVHTRRRNGRGWVISAVGGTATGVVMLVLAVTKFTSGAYIVVILIPSLVLLLLKINSHYRILAEQLRLAPEEPTPLPELKNTVLVLVPGIHKGVLPAIQYAKSLSPDCRAVYIEIDPADTALVEERWEKWGQDVPLVVLESPYRSLVQPILTYLEEVKEERAKHIVTVVIPEFVPVKFWHKILHNQSGIMLKFALLFRRDIIVANIRYYLEK
ncbi:MAG: APC family permease [Armatimonadetes bacterium]|nr:APC family permease [Armatimonadota bacterium]